jgi:hypothetical protein
MSRGGRVVAAIDTGCTMSMVQSRDQVSSTRDCQHFVRGYRASDPATVISERGNIADIPAIINPDASRNLLAPVDMMRVGGTGMIFTEECCYIMDKDIVREFIDSMKKSNQVIHEIPKSSSGLYEMVVPTSFSRIQQLDSELLEMLHVDVATSESAAADSAAADNIMCVDCQDLATMKVDHRRIIEQAYAPRDGDRPILVHRSSALASTEAVDLGEGKNLTADIEMEALPGRMCPPL